MNVASEELCRKLYVISEWKWKDTEYFYYIPVDFKSTESWVRTELTYDDTKMIKHVPAYDLGYLLRKLPANIGDQWLRIAPITNNQWAAYYITMGVKSAGQDEWADTPEDAVCKLAIELFKQGILKREENRDE